ncbi:hypothetical protein R70006_05031 [Paraburkholderia domus]|uniref:hypothetical protein n=1 Tax=Paraburkholderia domus TaxID=2793075 RepID=UPI001913BF4B|nr:hypothetical protein [Paraburkholderia domus]MBK5051732.1 hypothetical protein [Burkholderia sp. R-70006]CAE6795017.1 hypothetical protein R70006_05031 [Paraburkholderia domus]
MSTRSPVQRITRDEVLIALNQRGEDPDARRVDEIWERVGALDVPASGRDKEIARVVEDAIKPAVPVTDGQVFRGKDLQVEREVNTALEALGWTEKRMGGAAKGSYYVGIFGTVKGSFIGLFQRGLDTGPALRASISEAPAAIAQRFDGFAQRPLTINDIERREGHRDAVRARMRVEALRDFSDAELQRTLGQCVSADYVRRVADEMIEDGLTVEALYEEAHREAKPLPEVERAIAAKTSAEIEAMYPGRGSMPRAVVQQLYAVRDLQVDALAERATVTTTDLADLCRSGRFKVADELFQKCDDQAQHALLNDRHPHVRSAAILARRALDVELRAPESELSFDL